MSTMVKEKKPFLPQRKSAAPAGVGAGTSVAVASFGSSSAGHVVVGGEPRVHLLPSDVIDRKKAKLLKRRVAFGVLIVVVLVAAGYGAATFSLAQSQGALQSAQAQTSQLLTQQAKFGQVNKIKTDIASIQTGQRTATSQEILWQKFTEQLEGTLPAGASITDITASIDSPFQVGNTEAVPLIGPHIATVHVTLLMNEGTIAAWLPTLSTLKGFVDATPDSIKNTAGSQYTTAVTIYLNEKALSNRFVPKKATAGGNK